MSVKSSNRSTNKRKDFISWRSKTRYVFLEKKNGPYTSSADSKKAMAASRTGHQAAPQMTAPQHRASGPGVSSSNSPHMTAAVPQMRGGAGDTARPGTQIPRMMNGAMNGVVPPVQQQARAPPQMGSDSVRVYHEATRVQAEQIAQMQRQRLQQNAQINGQLGSSLSNPGSASLNAHASSEGRSSPATNGAVPSGGTSTSPRPNQPQSLSSGVTPAVNQIQAQLKLRNPQATPQEISRQTTEQLYRMSQAAMQGNAQGASQAGSTSSSHPNSSNIANIGGMTNSAGGILNAQQYAQMMRQQQMSQHRGSSAGSADLGGSRSGTPLNQRSGSAQSGRGMSQSPRAGQVGITGGQ